MGFETATLKDEEFIHLKEGGFFELILKHPEVELYRTPDQTFVMRIPGIGAVQMAQQKSDWIALVLPREGRCDVCGKSSQVEYRQTATVSVWCLDCKRESFRKIGSLIR